MKRSRFQRVFVLLLVLTLLCSLLPQISLPASAASYSGSCGSSLNWSLDTSSGKLTISGSGKMTDWEYASNVPWYNYYSSIKSVVISSGATSIGKNAFCFGEFTSVSIPKTVTAIGERAFYGCYKLESLTLPANLTTIGPRAFDSCSKLTTVTIPASVTTIGERAFYACYDLSAMTIPKGVTSIGAGAFAACFDLTKITVASGNTKYVSDSTGVLYDKNKTKLLQYPCAREGSYTIPSTVTTVDAYAFYCSSLTGVTIPTSVTTIGEHAFALTDLTKVTIPNSVTSVGAYAFADCDQLTSVTISNKLTSIPDDMFYACSVLPSVTIPSSVTSIGVGAFSSCYKLSSVTIPSSVKTISYGAFQHCRALKSVTLPSALTTLGELAFYDCSVLSSVTIPKSVTSIGDAPFAKCPKLSAITVASGNANYVSDSGFLFSKDKTKLIQAPGAYKGKYTVPSTVTEIRYEAFGYCAGLTGVTIPSNVKTIRGGAFTDCSTLASVSIAEGVTTIGADAFFACPKLSWVKIPQSVSSLSSNAFGYLTYSKTVDGFIIYGYPDSKAQTYASNHSITFRKLDPTSGFWDVSTTAYYYQPMLWALQNKITSGTSSVAFSPKGTCTREQIVTFLWKAKGSPNPKTTNNPFTDVSESKYYYKAVLWAVENKIASGTSATTFGVGKTCNRAAIVTFLYKAFVGTN